MMKRKKGYFSISAVAKMFSVHQQTIRLYEKEGLICPKRSDGNTRLFSEEDVERLEQVIYLTHQMGINLAGVEMILKLQRQIKKLQKEMNAALNSAQQELNKEIEISKVSAQESAKKLITIKREKMEPTQSPEKQQSLDDLYPVETTTEAWDIEYDQ